MTTVYTVYEMHTHKKLREYAKESQAKLYRDLVWAEKLKGEIRNGVYISVETIEIDEEFNEMAMSAMLDLGLPEDEAELLLEDFNCMAV